MSASSPLLDTRLPGADRSAETWMQRSGIVARCANPSCITRRSLWRALATRRVGISLHGEWFCDVECLEQSLSEQIERYLPPGQLPHRPHRMPIGLILLTSGAITQEQLREAIEAQRAAGAGRLGTWLRRMGYISERHVTSAIGQQWSRPVFPLALCQTYKQYETLVPFPILESSRMVIAHVSQTAGSAHAVFESRVDHTSLYAVEQMLGLRAQACIADESAIEQALDDMRQTPRPNEINFDENLGWEQIARTARSYASTLQAQHVRMATCSQHLWIYLESPLQNTHLLFRNTVRALTGGFENYAADDAAEAEA